MKTKYDAIVVGGGHNGLTTAAYLGKAGLQVLVLERRPVLGGSAATEAVFPGFRVNTGGWDAGLFLPEIVHDLALEEHGLRFLDAPGSGRKTALIHAIIPGSRSLTIWQEVQRTVAEISVFSKNDAANYPEFITLVEGMARALRPILTLHPPPLKKFQAFELLPWLRYGIHVERQGGRMMRELLRVLPMSISDWLDEWFESPALKVALGAAGTLGSMQGPKASGTAFMMLYHSLGGGIRSSRQVAGGVGALSEALAASARKYGAELCTGFPVRRILVQNDRAAGVEMDDPGGTQITARFILSSADPRSTYFSLVGANHLSVRMVREIKNIKYRGSLGRVNLALSALPKIPGMPISSEARGTNAHLGGHILLCRDLESLERAYDSAKYGRFPDHPFLDMAIPTLLDPTLAPPGCHLLTVNVQYAPYHLKDSRWEDQRERLGDRVVETLEEAIPGINSLILDRQVLTPLDLEQIFGLPEGCIYHGQMGLDQLLFMRPVAGAQGGRTVIRDLYLCGAGAHPGGGITGAPGYLAARQVINDYQKAVGSERQ